MPRKRHKSEEIVTKLRQVDVLLSQSQGIADAVRQIRRVRGCLRDELLN
jgi:putative transposase